MSEPFWTDHCTHGHDTYVASFIHYERRQGGNEHYERRQGGEVKTKVDIYIFPDDYFGQEICLRYGEEDSQYMSPTGLAYFIRSALHDRYGLYEKALEVIQQHGKIKWERNA